MKKKPHNELPLAYSCSGCSNIAQLANRVAIELDRDHIAEMSCIAGVGGGVKSLVKNAKSGRKIISFDDCHLHCVKSCHAVHGIKKKYHTDFLPSDVGELKRMAIDDLGQL